MKKTKIINIFLSSFLFFILVDGSNILISAPYGTKSHQNMYVSLMKELANRGHHVTVITNYPILKEFPDPKIREIIIDELAINMNEYPNAFEVLLSPLGVLSMWKIFSTSIFNTPPRVATVTYSHLEVKALINTDKKFDLVMVSQVNIGSSLPIAWHFKAPIIVLGPNTIFPGLASVFGDEDHYSYSPFFLTPFSDRMSLAERTINMLVSKVFDYISDDWHHSTIEGIARKKLIPNCPPISEIEKNISLVFTNSHPSFTYPRTLPPQVIEVGAIHCRPAKPLPEKLEKFISSSGDAGFIVFAVGTVLRMEDMPEEMVAAFINSFSRLPQRVIWQWKGKNQPKNMPKNVLTVPWIPQQDLLGRRGCRAFLTHGGLNSLQEAIYHRVPVLGLPFSTDQQLNMLRATRDGYALRLNWKEVTENTLKYSIDQILNNKKYKNAVDELSTLFRDQLDTPLKRAVYWTEFVMRHNGTDHLKLGSRDLSLFQRNLVDVYLIMFLIAITPLLLTFICLRKCCCRSKKTSLTKLNSEKKQQ